ncbi:hypothetical protein OAH98_03325 [Methylophilaceae bacterium]|nr:hypothetical protein [Methylophilaceae bacterium]
MKKLLLLLFLIPNLVIAETWVCYTKMTDASGEDVYQHSLTKREYTRAGDYFTSKVIGRDNLDEPKIVKESDRFLQLMQVGDGAIRSIIINKEDKLIKMTEVWALTNMSDILTNTNFDFQGTCEENS